MSKKLLGLFVLVAIVAIGVVASKAPSSEKNNQQAAVRSSLFGGLFDSLQERSTTTSTTDFSSVERTATSDPTFNPQESNNCFTGSNGGTYCCDAGFDSGGVCLGDLTQSIAVNVGSNFDPQESNNCFTGSNGGTYCCNDGFNSSGICKGDLTQGIAISNDPNLDPQYETSCFTGSNGGTYCCDDGFNSSGVCKGDLYRLSMQVDGGTDLNPQESNNCFTGSNGGTYCCDAGFDSGGVCLGDLTQGIATSNDPSLDPQYDSNCFTGSGGGTYCCNAGFDSNGVCKGDLTQVTMMNSNSGSTNISFVPGLKLKIGVLDAVNVMKLQRALANLNFYSGTASGVFNEATRNAVISFQRTYGLTPDGVAGTNTLSALMRAVSGESATTIAADSSEKHKHLINQRVVSSKLLATGSPFSRVSGTASCAAGEKVLGGGHNIEINSAYRVVASYPNSPSSWRVTIDPGIGGDQLADLANDHGVSMLVAMNNFLQDSATVYAVCAKEEGASGGASGHF